MNETIEKRQYTYADYAAWDDENRWELIEGLPYMMSAPSPVHQRVSGELFAKLHGFLVGKPCRVYYSPFDVRLNYDTDDDTVVQPDLLVVCDHSKIDNKGCNGAPDLVVEILSPSSQRIDRWHKFHAYQKAGVREFWIVDPENRTVQAHLLQDKQYSIAMYGGEDKVPVTVLPGCVLSIDEIFGETERDGL